VLLQINQTGEIPRLDKSDQQLLPKYQDSLKDSHNDTPDTGSSHTKPET